MTTKVNTMEPQDALNLLNQVSRQLSVVADVYDKIKEAVGVLDKVVKEHALKSEDEE